ncbi:MAG: hypothetical protein K2X38_15375 [Gemmataceae bacterium]|nr:hypothetical protein [Gemmataceae bacterium]
MQVPKNAKQRIKIFEHLLEKFEKQQIIDLHIGIAGCDESNRLFRLAHRQKSH